MTTTTEPTITHPAWCDTAQCDYAESEVHWSPASELEIVERGTVTLELSQSVDDETPVPWLALGVSSQAVTLEDVEALGAWLTARAAEYRATIAGKPNSPTILDEDTGLTIETHQDMVIMHGRPGPDGQWFFGPEEAQALAAALGKHAAEASA